MEKQTNEEHERLVTLKMPARLIDELDRRAQAEDRARSRASVIRSACRSYLLRPLPEGARE